jgi:predicted Zn-dependent protease
VEQKLMSELPPIVQLRQALDAVERQLVDIDQSPTMVSTVLLAADRIDELLAQLHTSQIDVRAEEVRVDTLRSRLQAMAERIVALVQRHAQVAALEQSQHWQQLAALAQQRAKQRLRRLTTTGGAVITLLVLLFVVLPWVFPPVPTADVATLQELVSTGKLADAQRFAEAEQQRAPNDAQIYHWLAALALQRNDADAAERWEQAARQLTPDEATLRFERGFVLSQAQLWDAASRETDALLALDGGVARGYYLRGHIAELRGEARNAIAAFTEAAEQANSDGDAQLAGLARSRAAFLTQQTIGP